MASDDRRIAATIHYLGTTRAPGHRLALQDGSSCAHCRGERVQKWGSFSGRRRYRCRDCSRTFSTFTGTPLHYLKHPDRWPRFLGCHDDRLTVRASAAVLGLDKDTTLRWRHRLLISWRSEPRRGLEGRIVIGDFSLPHSDKGGRYLQRPARRRGEDWSLPSWQTGPVTVLVALECGGGSPASDGPRDMTTVGGPASLVLESVGVRRVRGEDYDRRIKPRLREVTEIVGIRGPSCPLAAFARRAGAHYRRESRSFFPTPVFLVRGQLRGWLRPFRGVATRRLDNYLEWFRRRGGSQRPHGPRHSNRDLQQFSRTEPERTRPGHHPSGPQNAQIRAAHRPAEPDRKRS